MIFLFQVVAKVISSIYIELSLADSLAASKPNFVNTRSKSIQGEMNARA
jgi:hypothetical protein